MVVAAQMQPIQMNTLRSASLGSSVSRHCHGSFPIHCCESWNRFLLFLLFTLEKSRSYAALRIVYLRFSYATVAAVLLKPLLLHQAIRQARSGFDLRQVQPIRRAGYLRDRKMRRRQCRIQRTPIFRFPSDRTCPITPQDIYREAFNHAFAAHAVESRQEEAAHRIAWAAVKRSYVKVGDNWLARRP
jgi:cation transport regulator